MMIRLFFISIFFILSASSQAHESKNDLLHTESCSNNPGEKPRVHHITPSPSPHNDRLNLNALNLNNFNIIIPTASYNSKSNEETFKTVNKTPNANVDDSLLGITNQLKDINATLINYNKKDSWESVVKPIIPIVAGFIVFMWGAMNLTSIEARAKMAFISPLIDASSRAIKKAHKKDIVSSGDITDIIEPIVRIEPFLNQYDLIELFIYSNEKTFKIMKMSLPSNIITEIRERNILNKYLSTETSSITDANVRNTLMNQYDSALSNIMKEGKSKAPSPITFIRGIIIFLFLVGFGLCVYATGTA